MNADHVGEMQSTPTNILYCRVWSVWSCA